MLKEYRKKHRLKQIDMANLLNVSSGSYSLYETRKREMGIELIIKFLKLRNEKDDDKVIKILETFKKQQ